MKKKPQNKSYSPGANSNYLSTTDSVNMDTNAMGPMYEQIKSEVVSSVLNWLSMYMAADQEDKKINDQVIEPSHCCECILNRRIENATRSPLGSFTSHLSPNVSDYKIPTTVNNSRKLIDVSTSTEDDNLKSDKRSDTPEDENMIMTDFRAGQVWPDWCQYLEKAIGKHSNVDLSNSQVYYDKFNDRLCIYRRGLVEYPQMKKKSPRIENPGLGFKQNLKSIPEVRESLTNKAINIFHDKNKMLPVESLKENENVFNSNNRHLCQFLNSNFSPRYNMNVLTDHEMYNRHSPDMVKWASLPNVQFQE